MNSKTAFKMELQLHEECKGYIEDRAAPRNEIMEACAKAFCAVQEYRKVLQKKELLDDM